MMMKRLAMVATFLALLSACAAQRGFNLPPLDDWETRQAVLSEMSEWEFTGSIGVISNGDGFNGKLRWQQHEDSYQATVSGPLGVGTTRINGNSERVTVVDKSGQTIELANAEDDLRIMYGWTIPVASLRYWALGIPDPTSEAVIEFGDDGQLIHLEQRNWQVSITEYRQTAGQLMPRRIVATNDDAKVKLFVRRWSFF